VLEAPMVLKCFEEAGEKFGFTDEPSVIVGQSMGGAYAVQVAALDGSPFRVLVVISSFDELQTVVSNQTNDLLGNGVGAVVSGAVNHVFGWRTGVKISEIRSVEKAPRIRIPTLVIHGERDESIPVSSGRRLYDALPKDLKKEWLVVPGAGHNNILITDFPLYATMAEFLLKNL
jgi:uncharacterized protein